MWFNQYPYINVNDLNLDYLLRVVKQLRYDLENFVNINTIKYANPIQWNITKQYEANTVVIDANDGTAYLSVKPVPSGVAITNTDYWIPIFTLNLLSANQNITLRDDGSNVLATFASVEGDWLIWNNTLYKVTQAINVNEAYVVGYNLDRYSVELFIHDYITALTDSINDIIANIGDLDDLNTTDKTSIVDAVNEVLSNIGDLAVLNTTDKTNIVNALNEVLAMFGQLALITVDTFADLIAYDATLGDVIETCGYYTKGDNGGARYIVENTSYIDSVTLNNGLYARLISSPLKPEMFGCVCDGVTDDYTNFAHCCDVGVYRHKPIYISTSMAIDGTITIRTWLTIIGMTQGVTINELGDVDLFYANNSGTLYNVTIKNLHLNGNGNNIRNCLNFDNTDAGGNFAGMNNCDIGNLSITRFNMGIRCTNLWLTPKFHDLDISYCNTAMFYAGFDGEVTNYNMWGCTGNLGALRIDGAGTRFVNGKVYLNTGGSQTGGVALTSNATENAIVGLDIQDNNLCGMYIQGYSNVITGLTGSHNNEGEDATSYMINMESGAHHNIIVATSRNGNNGAHPKAHHYALYLRGTYNTITMSSIYPKTADYIGSVGNNYVIMNAVKL